MDDGGGGGGAHIVCGISYQDQLTITKSPGALQHVVEDVV